ncbi:hypothetical protein B296_00004688 [Ensete ventricosum]|uniref:Uncharacterized protein n=1 Tax=Ensete ventricosum TaxID=4639 RepID=A0A426YWI1_ENSVE|nr:hypothetical protein B296_00004688 [Ensete ventricosum]
MIYQYLRIIFEEDSESSTEKYEQELTLAEAVDAMAVSLEAACSSGGTSKEEHHNYDQEYHDRAMTSKETHHNCDQEYHDRATLGSSSKTFDGISETSQTLEGRNSKVSFKVENGETTIVQDTPYYRQRRMVLLYELLSACVADTPQDNKKVSQFRKGYDARHRVALRLLATWLDVKWIKVVCLLIRSFF